MDHDFEMDMTMTMNIPISAFAASSSTSPNSVSGSGGSGGGSVPPSGPRINTPELTASGCVRRKRVRTVTGCLVCRRRRVKCDEGRPRCKNCSKHPDRVCEYQYPAGRVEVPDPAAYPPVPMPVASAPPPPPRSAPYPTQFPIGQHAIHQSQYSDLAQQVQQIQHAQQIENVQRIKQEEVRNTQTVQPEQQVQQPPRLTQPDPSFYPPCDPSFYPPLPPPNAPTFTDPFSGAPATVAPAPLAGEPAPMRVSDPTSGTSSMTDTVMPDTAIGTLPLSISAPLQEFLQPHEGIAPRSFLDMTEGDSDAQLLATAAAYLSGGISMPGPATAAGYAHDVMGQYLQIVRRRSQTGQFPFGPQLNGNGTQTNGKRGSGGFSLLFSHVLNPTPAKWREQLAVGLEWAEARGGPGCVLDVTPPRPGFNREKPANVQPLATTVYSDMTALLSVLASLTDGTAPGYITSDPSWLIASRALQLQLSPGIPDLFEAVVCVPRIVIPVFARAVALASRRFALVPSSPDMVVEMLEFDSGALRTELESSWPARLASRPDTRRMQYGARLWITAALILTIHAVQGMPTDNPEVRNRVNMFFDLCSDALADLGDLNGWVWPITIVACAASGENRQRYKDLLRMARSTVHKDNTGIAVQIVDWVYDAQNRGEKNYHIHHAIANHPELDILIL